MLRKASPFERPLNSGIASLIRDFSPGVALFLKFLGLRKQSISPSAAKETA
jgi:hypothetical protein